MNTNDLKKGDLVRLRNGWIAEIYDNKKGNIRMAKVYGIETEIGSVYSHDIEVKLTLSPNGDARTGATYLLTTGRNGLPGGVYEVTDIVHTPAQGKLRTQVEVLLGHD